jgi:hypothetical protein
VTSIVVTFMPDVVKLDPSVQTLKGGLRRRAVVSLHYFLP